MSWLDDVTGERGQKLESDRRQRDAKAAQERIGVTMDRMHANIGERAKGGNVVHMLAAASKPVEQPALAGPPQTFEIHHDPAAEAAVARDDERLAELRDFFKDESSFDARPYFLRPGFAQVAAQAIAETPVVGSVMRAVATVLGLRRG